MTVPTTIEIDRAILDTLDAIDGNRKAIAFQVQRLLKSEGYTINSDTIQAINRQVALRVR